MGILEFILGVVSAVVGFLGGVLFYKQTKRGKEIENESKLSAEWEKLYREQKDISDRNGEKIGLLTEKVNLLTIRVEKAEPYICTNIDCELRKNNFNKKKL